MCPYKWWKFHEELTRLKANAYRHMRRAVRAQSDTDQGPPLRSAEAT